MHTFHYRLSTWTSLVYAALVVLIVAGGVRELGKWNGDWLALAFAGVPLVLALVHAWFGVEEVGAMLTVSERGIEYRHPRRPSKNWQLASDEIDFVTLRSNPFARVALIALRNGPPRQIPLSPWQPRLPVVVRDGDHPLMRSLRTFFPQRELTHQESGMLMMNSMELGKVTERLTYTSLGLFVVGFILLFVLPVFMLGNGIPGAAIAAVFVGAAAVSGVAVYRDRTAAVRVPAGPVLIASGMAFLFTVAAHKLVYLTGEAQPVEFRLTAEGTRGDQLWRGVQEEGLVLEVSAERARYRNPGTVVTLEIRRSPFAIDAIHRDVIDTLLRP